MKLKGVQVTSNSLPKQSLFNKKYTVTKGNFRQNLRAVCCKNRPRICKIEKSDFLKICQNKGFGELVLKI